MAPSTWSNPSEGNGSNPVAAQLESIAARLDSLLSLKDDIAALKILIYGTPFLCNDQRGVYESHPRFEGDSGDDKEPEGEPQSPVTDLVKEDGTDDQELSSFLAVTNLAVSDNTPGDGNGGFESSLVGEFRKNTPMFFYAELWCKFGTCLVLKLVPLHRVYALIPTNK